MDDRVLMPLQAIVGEEHTQSLDFDVWSATITIVESEAAIIAQQILANVMESVEQVHPEGQSPPVLDADTGVRLAGLVSVPLVPPEDADDRWCT